MFGSTRLNEELNERAPGRLVHTPAGAIYVEEKGILEGEPIILVHGLAASTLVWRSLSSFGPARVPRHHVRLVWAGVIGPPKEVPPSPLFRDQLREVVRACGIDGRFTLTGLSMGADAADYAAQYPEQIKQLILIAPAGVPTRRAQSGGRLGHQAWWWGA